MQWNICWFRIVWSLVTMRKPWCIDAVLCGVLSTIKFGESKEEACFGMARVGWFFIPYVQKNNVSLPTSPFLFHSNIYGLMCLEQDVWNLLMGPCDHSVYHMMEVGIKRTDHDFIYMQTHPALNYYRKQFCILTSRSTVFTTICLKCSF
jgi:hypothetical protein